MEAEMFEKVAKNVGCTVASLKENHQRVLKEQGENLRSAGKADDEVELMCLRVAAQQMRLQTQRLKRSGCDNYEGMFLSVPRYKDWGKFAYDKMATQLNAMPDIEARKILVNSGAVILYAHDDVDGGYYMVYNPSLAAKTPFTEGTATAKADKLPKEAVELEDGTYFVCVWNKTMPTFPNGNENFRYGKARPKSEPERTSMFLGRKVGETGEPRMITVKSSGEAAKDQYQTFVPCNIALRSGKDGTVAYAKAGVSTVIPDDSLTSLFTSPPHELMPKLLGNAWLTGLDNLEGWVSSLDEKEKWDAVCGMLLEVVHIDPREKGGYIITLGDMDLTSMAAPLDLYIGPNQEDLIDFGVGSVLGVVGNGWVGREGDGRLTINGWWAYDTVSPAESADFDDETDGEEW
mgnify:CR=1 FL=1